MDGRLLTLPNDHLGRPGCLWCYGHFGPPVVVFPSAAGFAHEWQMNSMIEAHAHRLAAGRMKLYCVESNVSQSWTAKDRGLDEQLRHHQAYERFVLETLVPFVYDDCHTEGIPITVAGISVGALLAVNFALKHPTMFHHAIGLSGRYNLMHFTNSESSEAAYFDNPLAFVPGLDGDALEQVRSHTRFTLVCGQGNWEDGNLEETITLGRLLDAKGIPCLTEIWGRDSHHQWPYWKQQTQHIFDREFG